MEAKTMSFRENLLPLTVQDTPNQTPMASLESITITETSSFVSLVDVITKMYSARAPRLPPLKRDNIIYGP
jgi:hypothetical protein